MAAIGEVVRGWRNGTWYANRPRTGVVLHNTQTFTPVSTLQSAGGWQRLIGRTGTVYRDVPDDYAAWHVAATGASAESKRITRWFPSWLKAAPDTGVSAANYSTYGVELEGFDQKYTEWQYAALKRVLYDWTGGLIPVVSHGQLQTDRTDPVRFDWQGFFGKPYAEQTAYFVPQKDPLEGAYLWPLPGTSWKDPLRGGYNFLDWTDSGHTPHPGVDLNVGQNCHDDAGLPVVSPTQGVIRFVGFDDATKRSVGWHVWVEDVDRNWHHFCHLQAKPDIAVGTPVVPGTFLGACGLTKGWDCEHLHWEIMRQVPDTWNFWPYNMSQRQVADLYLDPFTWMVARGTNGWEPGDMARLNERELYNVINNGWQQLVVPGVPCDQGSAHYKLLVDRLHNEKVCPLPYAPEFDHGLTEDGKKYTSQWWQDGTMSVWVDGMEKAELGG